MGAVFIYVRRRILQGGKVHLSLTVFRTADAGTKTTVRGVVMRGKLFRFGVVRDCDGGC